MKRDKGSKGNMWEGVFTGSGLELDKHVDPATMNDGDAGFQIRTYTARLHGKDMTTAQKVAIQSAAQTACNEFLQSLGLTDDIIQPNNVVELDNGEAVQRALLVRMSDTTVTVKHLRQDGKLVLTTHPLSRYSVKDTLLQGIGKLALLDAQADPRHTTKEIIDHIRDAKDAAAIAANKRIPAHLRLSVWPLLQEDEEYYVRLMGLGYTVDDDEDDDEEDTTDHTIVLAAMERIDDQQTLARLVGYFGSRNYDGETEMALGRIHDQNVLADLVVMHGYTDALLARIDQQPALLRVLDIMCNWPEKKASVFATAWKTVVSQIEDPIQATRIILDHEGAEPSRDALENLAERLDEPALQERLYTRFGIQSFLGKIRLTSDFVGVCERVGFDFIKIDESVDKHLAALDKTAALRLLAGRSVSSAMLMKLLRGTYSDAELTQTLDRKLADPADEVNWVHMCLRHLDAEFVTDYLLGKIEHADLLDLYFDLNPPDPIVFERFMLKLPESVDLEKQRHIALVLINRSFSKEQYRLLAENALHPAIRKFAADKVVVTQQ